MAAVYLQRYVKFETLISGTTPLYLSTGPLVGSPANEYDVLKLKGMTRGEQTVDPLSGTTTFPSFTFATVDPKPGPSGTYESTDTGQVMKLLYTNKNYLFATKVTVYEGDSVTNYASFTPIYTGTLNDPNRDAGSYVFELMPYLNKLANPITFPTGSFQVQTAFDYNAVGVNLYNGTSFTPPTRTNVLTALNPTWTVDTGAMTNLTGTAPKNNNGAASTCHADVTIGSASSNAKLGVCYTFYAQVTSAGGVLNGDTLSLTVAGYNGGSLVDSYTSNTITFVLGTGNYVGVMYVVTDPTVTKIRLSIAIDDSTSTNNATINTFFSVSNSWLIGRELVDILSWDSTTYKALLAARGGLGSNATYHGANEQALRCTVVGGHPNDIARRLMLTTTTAGGNGTYDPGDGLGLGAQIPSSIIDGTWDSEKSATDSGTDFSGYNFARYKMLFFITEKIPSLLDWLQQEICKPVHANMVVTNSGTLGIHYWRSSETAGAGALTDSSIIRDSAVEISPKMTREPLVNYITFRMDEDTLGSCDVQGNQSGGTSGLLREWTFTEASFGEDSTTVSSLALNGLREMLIESRGLRGASSVRFGYCGALGGDQTAFEVARRIMTRHRFPIPSYEVRAPHSKRSIRAGDIISVTSSVMPNPGTGAWGRSAEKMAVELDAFDSDAGEASLTLRAVQDVVAIPNTTTPGAPAAPVNADISTVRKQKTLLDQQSQDQPIWPKDYANMVWLTLAAPQAAGRTILVYACFSPTNTYPGDSSLELVGEILPGDTQLYFLATGNGAGLTYGWVKISARNDDRVESAKNPNEQVVQYWTGAAWATGVDGAFNHGPNRGSKLEIRQIGAGGSRETVQLGMLGRT